MPNYKYRAFDPSGKITEASIDAPNRGAALDAIRAMSLEVVKISADGNAAEGNGAGAKKGGGEKTALALFRKLQQLCGRGGLPVSDAVKSLSARALDPKLKSLSRELYRDLSEGRTLASSMERFPDTFDPCMVHLVEAGEATANLEFVFSNLIKYIEDRRKLRSTIISALAYPVFLCVLAGGVVMLFLFFMLPKIKSMMANMGAEENFPIRVMEFIGDAMTRGIPVSALLLAAAGAAAVYWRRSERGLRKSDSLALRIPVLGKIAFDADVARYATLSSTLFASGVNTTETFKLAEKSVKNSDMRLRFQLFRTSVNDGAPISAALQRYGLLSNEDIDIVSAGERTGSFVEGFAEVARAHSDSLGLRIKFMTAALGGAALGTAFLLVLIFAMGIVMSILGLSQSMTGA